jgi:hypothetical protein
MIQLNKALLVWGTSDFRTVLRQELENCGAECLPLQQGLVNSSYVIDTPITVTINSIAEREDVIRVRVGVFYQGVIGGCSCADDPTPTSENNEYCELSLEIDKLTAMAAVALVE